MTPLAYRAGIALLALVLLPIFAATAWPGDNKFQSTLTPFPSFLTSMPQKTEMRSCSKGSMIAGTGAIDSKVGNCLTGQGGNAEKELVPKRLPEPTSSAGR